MPETIGDVQHMLHDERQPIALTDSQMTTVMQAARPLLPADRAAFLQALASALRGRGEIGDGELHRAIRTLQREHFRPPVGEELRAPAAGARRARAEA